MRVWQRYDYLYTTYGPKIFDIWISNDSNPADGMLEDWEVVGRYSIEKAPTDAEAMQEAIDGHEFWIYPAEVDFTREFQYLRFKCIAGRGLWALWGLYLPKKMGPLTQFVSQPHLLLPDGVML